MAADGGYGCVAVSLWLDGGGCGPVAGLWARGCVVVVGGLWVGGSVWDLWTVAGWLWVGSRMAVAK